MSVILFSRTELATIAFFAEHDEVGTLLVTLAAANRRAYVERYHEEPVEPVLTASEIASGCPARNASLSEAARLLCLLDYNSDLGDGGEANEKERAAFSEIAKVLLVASEREGVEGEWISMLRAQLEVYVAPTS